MLELMKQLYREWLISRPLYEIESAETHAIQFAAWVAEQEQEQERFAAINT